MKLSMPPLDAGFMEGRIRTMLPPAYQQNYKDVLPRSMGSAALKYKENGLVAWDEMWGSFCDLAMAGGPPHRGTLLEAASSDEVSAQPVQYGAAVNEICRGIRIVTGLTARTAATHGWLTVDCASTAHASWLARAITMENVQARCDGSLLSLPAGPDFRLEKEIKNVITSIAKCSHYWSEHIPPEQQSAIGKLLDELDADTPLLQPDYDATCSLAGRQALGGSLASQLLQKVGLRSSLRRCGHWLGIGCEDVATAITMMRLLVVNNVLARREGTLLFLPLSLSLDPEGDKIAALVETTYTMARKDLR